MDVDGTLQLFNSDHVRERDKALLRSILVGSVWNGFLLQRVKGQRVPCRFCGLVEIREHPQFHDLTRMDKAPWPGVCFGLLVASSLWGQWWFSLG